MNDTQIAARHIELVSEYTEYRGAFKSLLKRLRRPELNDREYWQVQLMSYVVLQRYCRREFRKLRSFIRKPAYV